MARNKPRRRSIVLSDSHASQATSEPPETTAVVETDQEQADSPVARHGVQVADELESAPDEPLGMAQDVWESLKEEYYEQIEQLPLSLHRSFALIGEQDKEVEVCQIELLPTIRSYVKLRQSIHASAARLPGGLVESLSSCHPETASRSHEPDLRAEETAIPALRTPQQPLTGDSGNDANNPKHFFHKEEDLDVNMEDVAPRQVQRDDPPNTPSSHSLEKPSQPASARTHGLRQTDATVPKSVPFPPRPKPKTTRELLTRISFLTAELLRASEEKVGLATAAYDSVDRHVRALDASIKENETAAALGLREGTRPTGMAVLEENDPTLSEAVDEDDDEPQLGMIGPTAGSGERPPPRSKRNRKRDRRDQRKHVSTGQPATRVHAVATAPPPDMPIDPNEPRYCYCNQVSYGEMIACDNPDCAREWFHLGCAGLAAPPKGKVKWYCRDCEEALGRNRRRRLR